MDTERPVSVVPRVVLYVLISTLVSQIVWHASQPKPVAQATELDTAPSAVLFDLISMGDPIALSKILILRIQSFDNQPGISIPFNKLDYHKVVSWLERVAELDPYSRYPYLLAARVYAQVNDPERKRIMLNFVHSGFLKNPELQWPAMVQAVFIARHRLKDLDLALRYARDIRLNLKGEHIPSWVRQMELFVLEEMGDLESAKVLLGAFLDAGLIENERELKFLQGRLGVKESD